MLREGSVKFARHLFSNHPATALHFAEECIEAHDTLALQIVISAIPDNANHMLVLETIFLNDIRCLRVLLDSGVRFMEVDLLAVAVFSRHLDILELMLEHGFDWSPALPGQAACAGKVRFLMRIFEAGCRRWVSAIDGEPVFVGGCVALNSFVPVGQQAPQRLPDWTLVVSSNLVLSGPVLLFAAQMVVGLELTPRMKLMLADVRRRAVALALCFHRAARLWETPEAPAYWGAMGRVPLEVVQNIATLARISISAVDLVT